MSRFIDRLLESSRRSNSLLCVGLDVNPERVPEPLRGRGDWVARFNRGIIEATSDLVCAYKPNLAFYEALGEEGMEGLRQTLKAMPQGVLVIGDAKRGDVGHTASAYARALFDQFGFDAITVSPYMGKDSVEPFLGREDRGVFVLCKTSNPGSMDFQNLSCMAPEGRLPLYQLVAMRARHWNSRGNVGLVVGATFPQELGAVRGLAPDLPLLIPGVGAQAGDLERTVLDGTDAAGELAVINSSRQIIFASSGDDWQEAARSAAARLRDSINGYRAAKVSR
ncbi:MAG TPA: orotidine-5'-phosphate decarboxylase [Chloroflexota bacterium]|nr:orotidine-5'-phosphate decarboxylase [Chloroflexota bacterium]